MFKLDDSLGFLINRAAIAMRWALEERLARHDLTAPQWAILARLWEEDGQVMSAVGKKLYCDKPTISGIVDRLEQKELVQRVRDSEDRRVIRIYLTKKGKELGEKLPIFAKEVNEMASNDLTNGDIKRLKNYLQIVWNNLG